MRINALLLMFKQTVRLEDPDQLTHDGMHLRFIYLKDNILQIKLKQREEIH